MRGSDMLKLKALLAIPLMMLASCNEMATDGYTFEKKEYTKLAPDIRFVIYATERQMVAAAPKKTRLQVEKDGRELKAFAIIRGNTCTVHTVDPALTSISRSYLGHEITHCIYGRWHS
jgi:hypothetical protein